MSKRTASQASMAPKEAASSGPPAAKVDDTKDVDNSAKKQRVGGPKRCVLVLFGYNGQGYKGLQLQPDGSPTIDSEMVKAIHSAGGISDSNVVQLQKVGWQRCARTDKGVHAASNVIRLKMMLEPPGIVERINSHLPPQIRVFGVLQVTKGFHAKKACEARSYEYIIPSYAFQSLSEYTAELKGSYPDSYAEDRELTAEEKEVAYKYRISDAHLARIEKFLAMYEGTKNYHNFTNGKKFRDASAQRYLIQCNVISKFERGGLEYLHLHIHGASFMIHQIRKMVAVLTLVGRGVCSEDLLERAFEEQRLTIPTAPALGLLLDRPFFPGYDKKVTEMRQNPKQQHANRETTESFFEQHDATRKAFKEQYITSHICDIEVKTASYITWLRTKLDFPQFWGVPQTEHQTDWHRKNSNKAKDAAAQAASSSASSSSSAAAPPTSVTTAPMQEEKTS